jgi:two-component system response regulator HydG
MPSDQLAAIVGGSPDMTALKAYLPKVANSLATVLITGETGTGKECVAKAIHGIGPRSRNQFVALNCAAVPDSLVEAELFGYVRGAFTGAVTSSEGYIVRANGGTLFLDEVAEMSTQTQARLLRVLDGHEVTPLGSRQPIPVDVRVIAATNQPLENMVAAGHFRPDLYYRLSVARLALQPLRERKEDIPLLIESTIRELNARDNSEVSLPDTELLHCLLAHDWPGNVRELRNLIEAIFIDPPAGRIGLADLPPVFRNMFSAYRPTAYTERDRLVNALQDTHWNKAEAAKQLNWSRMTLYRKLAKYHLEKSG